MLSEHQSYVIGTCNYCGASRIVCDEWNRPEWGNDGDDPECLHGEIPEPEILYSEEKQIQAINETCRKWFKENNIHPAFIRGYI